MDWRGEESATGQALALLVAGSVLLGSVGLVVWTGQYAVAPSGPQIEDAALRAQAESLLDILLAGGVPGGPGGEDLHRIGLAHSDGGLSLDRIDLLRGASLEMVPGNGLLDYEEALAAIGATDPEGLDRDLRFHLRVYPIGIQHAAFPDDLSHIRTAYIGDWSSLASATVSLGITPEATAANARLALDAQMHPKTVHERAMLEDLGLGFNDRVHITTNYPTVLVNVALGVNLPIVTLVDLTLLEGDVYPDNAAYLQNVLPARIGQYDLVIVGSGVSHQAMVHPNVRNALADWVLDGGTLIVLGSGSQNTQWMQPLFGVGAVTANHAPFSPDATHPILKEPNELAWTGYDAKGLAWNLGSEGVYGSFSHIIMSGAHDLLAFSNEGTLGEGRLFITAFQPREIQADLGFEEARNFLHNLIVYADRNDMFLQYGPPVPDGVAVGSAVRHTFIQDEVYGQVPVRAEILVWRE